MSRQGATRQITRAAMLAVAAAVALPAAAQARVVETVSVSKETDVPAGETRSLTLKCPARAVALNGSAPTATSSIPGTNARRWTFRFAAGPAAESANATLRCVRLRLPRNVTGVGLAVGTVIEPIFEVPPGNTQNLTVKCPAGEVPTGWGLERTGDDNGLSIAKAHPTKKRWSFAVENAGTTGARGNLHIRCLERKQRASSGQRHTFATRLASFTEQLEGDGTVSRSCRASEYSVATGVSLPSSDDILLTGTGVVGDRGGEWSFVQPSGATAVKTSIICLSRATGFRR